MTIAPQAISLRYTLVYPDLEQLVKHAKSRLFGWSGKTMKWVVMGYLVAGIAMMGIGLPALLDLGETFEDRLPFYLGLLGSGACVVGFSPIFLRWAAKRSSEAYQKLPLSLHLVVDDSGIKSELDGQSGHTAWRVIERAVESESHFLLYLNRLRGFVIPKSAFEDDVSMANFRALVAQNAPDLEQRRN